MHCGMLQPYARRSPNSHTALRPRALAGRLDGTRKAVGRLRGIDPTSMVSEIRHLTAMRSPRKSAKPGHQSAVEGKVRHRPASRSSPRWALVRQAGAEAAMRPSSGRIASRNHRATAE
jgi:hypothetical protein